MESRCHDLAKPSPDKMKSSPYEIPTPYPRLLKLRILFRHDFTFLRFFTEMYFRCQMRGGVLQTSLLQRGKNFRNHFEF